MPSPLSGKKILLGVCGSIAAYKGCEFVRYLRALGAEVTVILTSGGERFVSSLSFAALSANRVYGGMFDPADDHLIPHINLSRDHDLILIAPATAQTIGRLAHGSADDLLSAVVLAATIPVVVCPAMNSKMFRHPATGKNLQTLMEYGYTIVEPDSGKMACNEEGPGRLAEWAEIYFQLASLFLPQDFRGKKILVTAGPTEEPLDPVRFLSNNSSGKMGYALAEMAARRGAEVILVSGPTTLELPHVKEVEFVRTAAEMEERVGQYFAGVDGLIMVAAVSDFRPAVCESQKMKKVTGVLTLGLAANNDILMGLSGQREKQFMLGFAAESEHHKAAGFEKMERKNLDMIVINDIKGSDTGFRTETNAVTILHRNGDLVDVPLGHKDEISMVILDEMMRGMDGV